MDSYIKLLFDRLADTVFSWRQQEVSSYEEGMRRLVDAFTDVKRNQKYAYFVGNGG